MIVSIWYSNSWVAEKNKVSIQFKSLLFWTIHEISRGKDKCVIYIKKKNNNIASVVEFITRVSIISEISMIISAYV